MVAVQQHIIATLYSRGLQVLSNKVFGVGLEAPVIPSEEVRLEP